MQVKRLVSPTGLVLLLALFILMGAVAWSSAPPGPSFDVLDNARAPSTGDEAVGVAYLRLTFPYDMYVQYSSITLHVEETAGHDGQEEDWTQSQGQMSSSGSSAKFEFYGPTTSSPDIALRNTITGGTAALGSNEKEGASLSIGVSDTHYLGVAILDDQPERYRSHTARWALASGWKVAPPSCEMLKYKKAWEDSLGGWGALNSAYEVCGALRDENAPEWWLYRGRWPYVGTGYEDFVSVALANDLPKAVILNGLANDNVWVYEGHGCGGMVRIRNGSTSDTTTYLRTQDVPAGHLELALVLACFGADVAQAISTQNNGCFAVGPENVAERGLLREYCRAFFSVLRSRYTHDYNGSRALGRIHFYVTGRQRRYVGDVAYEGLLDAYGDGSHELSPASSGPVFSGA